MGEFSIRELLVCLTWYAIYAGIVTALRLSDWRFFAFLLIGPLVGVLLPGAVVLFAPKHRRWLIPVTIGLAAVLGGFMGWWLAVLNKTR